MILASDMRRQHQDIEFTTLGRKYRQKHVNSMGKVGKYSVIRSLCGNFYEMFQFKSKYDLEEHENTKMFVVKARR